MANPFFCGSPVPVELFLDRWQELHRVARRIANYGQSTAVVGEPRSGKTSLLHYLSAPETRADLYDAGGTRLLFSFIDNEMLSEQFTQAQFWELALRPVYEQVVAPNSSESLAQAYRACQENAFGNFVLERLFAQMGPAGWRLALLLDEFDFLLYHPVLNSIEFFGGLRGLASCSKGALALVIASRQSVTAFNVETQKFSRTGSPYFNFLSEITLGPLPNKAIEELLGRAGDRFTKDDQLFIKKMAGGHPYLLQAAAAALWEAYEDGEGDPNQRRQQVGEDFYDQATSTLSNIWQFWSPATQRAFATIALGQISSLELGEREFHLERLAQGLLDLRSELRALQKQGFIIEDATMSRGWQVCPGIFLWWLANKVVQMARDDTPFEKWLLAQEWEGQLTRGEKEKLREMGHVLGGLLGKGVTSFIEAVAKGAAKGLADGA